MPTKKSVNETVNEIADEIVDEIVKETAQRMPSTVLKKITSKAIMGKIPRPEDGEIIDLYTVIGKATGFKTGESNYGAWAGLTGIFEAINIETGQVFVSPIFFMVEPMQGFIIAELSAKGEDDKPLKKEIDFSYVISVRGVAATATGYEYVARAIQEPNTTDPLAALRGGALAALPAPSAD